MKVMVLGGDGFCGWPTALKLVNRGHDVMIVDNFSRRGIDMELNSNSLTRIADINSRIDSANMLIGPIDYRFIDIAEQYDEFKMLVQQCLIR